MHAHICSCIHKHMHMHTYTHTHTHHPYVATYGDYDALTNFCLGPFSNDVRQRSFNVSIVDDNSPEGAETFSASLTVYSVGQDRLSSRVMVSPAIVTVMIQDDGKQL